MSDFRIRATGEVVSQGELRKRNANTSFPAAWDQNVFDFLGIDPVFYAPPPVVTNPLQIARGIGVTQDANGNWVTGYEVVDMFVDTTDENGNVVTKASQESAYTNKLNEQKWANVRNTRDNLLKETDWLTIRAADTGVALSAEWAAYRQELRDITEQADPFNITWPVKPE